MPPRRKSHNTLFNFRTTVGANQLKNPMPSTWHLIGSRQWLLQTVSGKVVECITASRSMYYLFSSYYLLQFRLTMQASYAGRKRDIQTYILQSWYFTLASTDMVLSKHLRRPGIRTSDLPALRPKVLSIRLPRWYYNCMKRVRIHSPVHKNKSNPTVYTSGVTITQ